MIHIVNESAVGGTMIAKGIRGVQSGCDALSVGTLHIDDNEFIRGRAAFWSSISGRFGARWPDLGSRCGDGYKNFLEELSSIGVEEEIVLWVGTYLDDQLFVLWVSALLYRLGRDSNLYFAFTGTDPIDGSPIVDPLLLSEASWTMLVESRRLATKSDVLALRKLWIEIASGDPGRLSHAVRSSDSTVLALVGNALPLLEQRFPSLDEGVPRYLVDLLVAIETHGPNFSSVVGHFVHATLKTRDRLSDLVIMAILDSEANLAEGQALISMNGSVRDIKTCQLSLSAAGKELLQSNGKDFGYPLRASRPRDLLPSQAPNWWYSPVKDGLVFR